MKTIEEVAYNLYPVYRAIANGRNIDTNEDRRRVFMDGATEQKQIDIEKAVRWLKDNINKYLFNDNSNGKYRDWLKCSSQAFVDFRKAMEK